MALVRDVMTTKVKAVSPDTKVSDAAAQMKSNDIGFLPVAKGNNVTGVLTDRDITLRVVAEGKDPKTVTVNDIMTQGVESCSPDDGVDTVIDMMKSKQIRRVVVMDKNNNLTGICSLGDLSLHAEKETSGEVLKEVSKDK